MGEPRFSVAETTTPGLSFDDDLAAYEAAGAQGIGIDEAAKLKDAGHDAAAFAASSLAATFCLPATNGVLPFSGGGRYPGVMGPGDPKVRIDRMCESVQRLAAFKPSGCVFVTGPLGLYERDAALEIVAAGMRRVARTAAAFGMTVAVEPIHHSISRYFSFVNSIPDAVELLAAIDEPNVGLLVDVWHVWDSPDLLNLLEQHADRVVAVHLNDRREPTRSWCDRLLPGDGVADVAGIVGALRRGGYDGWFELEVVSDDGRFGSAFPDSLWRGDAVALIRAGREKFLRAWHAADTGTSTGAAARRAQS
jgi:sugar phosphate isomerase/epimerase